MKMFYFSGTGNSFYVAKRIAGENNQAEIISIPAFLKRNEKSLENDEIIIVSPIYFYGIPQIALRFLEQIEFKNIPYFSVIFTAEFPNGLAMNMLKEICKNKGIILNSCFYIKMPTNYVIKSKLMSPTSIDTTLEQADKKIEKIAGIIKKKRNHKENDLRLYSLIVSAKRYHQQWETDFPQFDSKFLCTEACTACKLCEKRCPVGNITVTKKPHWNGQCEACLRCINICPQNAIQYDHFTEDKERYFNPRVNMNELV